MIQPYDVLKAAENGRRAIRRGDVDAADAGFASPSARLRLRKG